MHDQVGNEVKIIPVGEHALQIHLGLDTHPASISAALSNFHEEFTPMALSLWEDNSKPRNFEMSDNKLIIRSDEPDRLDP